MLGELGLEEGSVKHVDWGVGVGCEGTLGVGEGGKERVVGRDRFQLRGLFAFGVPYATEAGEEGGVAWVGLEGGFVLQAC